MFIEKAADVKSVYMINKDMGYLIDNKGKMFELNANKQTYQHIVTIQKDIKGYTKLVAHNEHIFIFNKKSQKIYAISLNEKIHKWYYYNQSNIMKLIDITIYDGQVYLLMLNKKNSYIYLNLLDLARQEYDNLLRFPRNGRNLNVTISKGKAYIYDDNYKVNSIYDLTQGQEENIQDSFCLLKDCNNVENQYFISEDLSVIIINRENKALQVIQSTVPYRIGVNTILA